MTSNTRTARLQEIAARIAARADQLRSDMQSLTYRLANLETRTAAIELELSGGAPCAETDPETEVTP